MDMADGRRHGAKLASLFVGLATSSLLAAVVPAQSGSLAEYGAGVEEKDGKPFRVQLTDRFDTAGFSLLAGSATIEEIDARFCKQLGDADLASFSELTNLRKLYLPSGVGDRGMQYLQGLRQLEVLHLGDANITAAGMAHLRRLTNLVDLGLWRCTKITDDGFQHLRGMTRLKRLDLRRCELLTDRCLKHVKHLNSLESLDFSVIPGITDEALRHVARLRKLKALGTTRTAITNLAPLRQLTELENLNVPEAIDDAQLVHLETLTKLRRLSLEVTNVTDDGMAHLRNLKQLTWLDVHKTNVSDSCLHHLQRLLNLRYLQLQETHVSRTGLRQIQAALPRCEIIPPWHTAG